MSYVHYTLFRFSTSPIRDYEIILVRLGETFLGITFTSGTYEIYFAFYISMDVWEHIKAILSFLSVENLKKSLK